MTGQRNAIDGRIVEIVAELDRDGLVGITGARSVRGVGGLEDRVVVNAPRTPSPPSPLGWSSFRAARQGLREGRLSLDQVGVIAARAGVGSDAHYAATGPGGHGQPAAHRVKLEPRPHPTLITTEPQRSITKTVDEQLTCWQITRANVDAAQFDAALQTHQEALIAEWHRDHDTAAGPSLNRPPVPGTGEAFMRLVRGRLGHRGR